MKAAVPRHRQALPCREERELRRTAREHLQDIHSPLKRAAIAVNCGFRKPRVVCTGCETLPAAAGSARLPTRRHLVPPSGAGDYYRVFIRLGSCFVKMPCFSWQRKKQRETRPIISIKKWSKFADAKCPSQGWKQERSRGSEKYVALPPLDANGLLDLRCSKLLYSGSANSSAKQHAYINLQTTGVWIPKNFMQRQKSCNAVSDHSFFVIGK